MAQRAEHDKRSRLVDPTPEWQEFARATFPQLLTSFVGRSEEIAAIETLLTRSGARLATLTGTGGIGKTRLALGVAVHLQDYFADGVWLVSLAALTDPELVVPTIGHVLRIGEQPNVSVLDLLVGQLRGRNMCLVLDNFEHVVEAATDIAELIASCPELRLLVTSREPLRLSGEREFPVPPLPVSANPASAGMSVADGDAVRLFVDRATHVVPGFALTCENAPVIVEICRRLEGMPLAVELAAARIKVLSPEDLLARLDQPLAVLTGGPRDAPTRQQTMRATLQWSYDLLPEDEQLAFRSLSVFAGGWTLPAAEAVVGSVDTLETLSLLVDKGLVRRIDQPGQPTRYGMLEPVRQFACERLEAWLEEAVALRDRHASYFRSTVEGLQSLMDGPDGAAVGDRVEIEYDNLRTALVWLRESGQIEEALLLVGEMGNFWFQRGYINEGLAQAETLLNQPAASQRTIKRARALWPCGWLWLSRGEIEAALQRWEEAHGIFAEQGDQTGLALARFGLGVCREELGEDEQARSDYEHSLALFRELEYDTYVVRVLSYLGNQASRHGELERARNLLEEAIALARAKGLKQVTAVTLRYLGQLAEQCGDDEQAADHYAERLTLVFELGHLQHIPITLDRIAAVVHRQRRPELAVCLLGVASAIRERTGIGLDISLDNDATNKGLNALRAELPAPVVDAAWERGRATPLGEAVNLALRALESVDVEGAPTPVLPAGLTPREGEVLRLIAGGHSNREIAEALFLSPRTVERHIANIYLKIDVHSKAEATAYARRQHLI